MFPSSSFCTQSVPLVSYPKNFTQRCCDPCPRSGLLEVWGAACSCSSCVFRTNMLTQKNVDIASVSPCANTEISMGGVLPAASSLLRFNILSAVICSPRLTHCVSLSLLTLPCNSPQNPLHHIYVTPRPLTPESTESTPAPARRPEHNASLCHTPVAPFLFIDHLFPIKIFQQLPALESPGKLLHY